MTVQVWWDAHKVEKSMNWVVDGMTSMNQMEVDNDGDLLLSGEHERGFCPPNLKSQWGPSQKNHQKYLEIVLKYIICGQKHD